MSVSDPVMFLFGLLLSIALAWEALAYRRARTRYSRGCRCTGRDHRGGYEVAPMICDYCRTGLKPLD